MRLYITKGELSLTLPLKPYFARKRASKLRSPLRMMNYIRRSSSELRRSVMSLRRAVSLSIPARFLTL